ncbi:hypothetical protein Q8A73_012507 [Channa argus]|nr:hypothetical protein Q8A73_012507 [Channa argus]
MSKNIVKPLSQAQICGEGLRVIGEGIRKKQVWGDKLSFVLVEIILGAKGEDVIPVLSPADMEALKAALTFSCQKLLFRDTLTCGGSCRMDKTSVERLLGESSLLDLLFRDTLTCGGSCRMDKTSVERLLDSEPSSKEEVDVISPAGASLFSPMLSMTHVPVAEHAC